MEGVDLFVEDVFVYQEILNTSLREEKRKLINGCKIKTITDKQTNYDNKLIIIIVRTTVMILKQFFDMNEG